MRLLAFLVLAEVFVMRWLKALWALLSRHHVPPPIPARMLKGRITRRYERPTYSIEED